MVARYNFNKSMSRWRDQSSNSLAHFRRQQKSNYWTNSLLTKYYEYLKFAVRMLKRVVISVIFRARPRGLFTGGGGGGRALNVEVLNRATQLASGGEYERRGGGVENYF